MCIRDSLLKIEPGTVFDRQRKTLLLPDEETVCTLYETACEELERHGYRQYEISNFAHPGFESRHNLKYWRCEEYLGLGPSAHSFLNGRRFYFPRSLKGFLSGGMPVDDGPGGDAEEMCIRDRAGGAHGLRRGRVPGLCRPVEGRRRLAFRACLQGWARLRQPDGGF